MFNKTKLLSSYWFIATFFSLMQRFSTVIVGVGAFVILVRILTNEEMGVWTLFLTISTFIEVVKNGLIKNAFIRNITSCKEKEKPFVEFASIIINIGVTVFATLILLLIVKPLSLYWSLPILEPMFYQFLISLWLLIPFSHLEYLQQANLKFKGVFYTYLVRQSTFLVLIVSNLFFIKNNSLPTLVVFQNIGLLLGVITSVFFAKEYSSKNMRFDIIWLKRLLNYGKFSFATNISSQLFRSTDSIMVASFISTSGVALYGVCIRISNLIDLPSNAVSDVLFPKSVLASNLEGGQKQLKLLYEQSVAGILSIMFPVSLFVLFFPKIVLYLVAGENYIEAANILSITIIYGLFLPFLKQFGTIMDSINKPNMNFYVILATSIFNIIFNFILLKKFGLMGAAAGTLLSYIFSFFISQFLLFKELKVNFINVFINILTFYKTAWSYLKVRFMIK